MTATRGHRGLLTVAAAVLLAGCTGSTGVATSTPSQTSASATGTSAPANSPATSGPETSSASGTGSASPTAGTGSPQAALDQALAELVAMPGGPPGVISIVQVGDDRTVHTAGVADVKTGAAPDIGDHMRIASAAKAFSGATALALVDKGVLSVDDTIGKWLPDQPKAWANVTLRQLLSHTSGLPDFSKSPEFAKAVGASLTVPPPPEKLLTYVADEPLQFPPGSQYLYDNSDNIAAALMIQAATKKTYAQALKEQVLDPLGLTGTSLPVGIEVPEPVLRGYELDPPNPPEDVTGLIAAGWSWASGGIVSTPQDMNTFIRGYVGGKLFGPGTQALQTKLFIPGGESGPPGPGINSASMALFRYETPCGVVYGHTGNTPGYTQFAVASPDGTRSATMAMNLARNADGKGPELQVLHALQQAEAAAVCAALAG
jgi:D-alanyl-D-alanine carboxypeptidase